MKIYQYGIHAGEERAIVGNHRAGMVVFAGCHLRCAHCYTPEAVSGEGRQQLDLEEVFEALYSEGAGNLNLITPAHVWPTVHPYLEKFRKQHPGFPVVAKTSGYEGLRLAREMAKVVDIIVMDFKVYYESSATRANLPKDYSTVAKAFLVDAMSRLPQIVESQKLRRGLVVRTLWMPHAAEDAVAIGEELERAGFAGPWNLMRCFVQDRQLQFAPLAWDHFLRERFAAKIQIWRDGTEMEEAGGSK